MPELKPEAANAQLPAFEVPMSPSDWLIGIGSNKSLLNQTEASGQMEQPGTKNISAEYCSRDANISRERVVPHVPVREKGQ